MKITELYSYKSQNQIWRILISSSEKLLIETRNINSKEVFFNCFRVFNGQKIFGNLQLEEKFWIGIEAFYNDIILFHKFAKPDMPGHKEIIAFDINSQNVLWKNDKYTFQFVLNDLVYCYVQMFDSRKFFALDLKTGSEIENLDEDFNRINELKKRSEDEYPYNDYIFPLKFDGKSEISVRNIIEEKIKDIDIVGDVEYNVYGNLLLTSFHSKTSGESLMNQLHAIEIDSGKEIFSKVLNSSLNAFVPYSFFVYKNLLFTLREKNELIVYKLG